MRVDVTALLRRRTRVTEDPDGLLAETRALL
jgi:hypothetical protein